MSQEQRTRLLKACASSFTKNLKVVRVLPAETSGMPMQVYTNGVNLARGTPGFPFTSSNEYSKSA